jgi:hypothetical protein
MTGHSTPGGSAQPPTGRVAILPVPPFAEEAVVRRAVIVLTVLLALLGAAGCSGSAGSRSNRTQCVNGVCQVSLSGEQTIELEIGSFERDLRVGPIEPNAVTLSVRDDQARLAPGESAQLGRLQIRVKSVSPPATELEVVRA